MTNFEHELVALDPAAAQPYRHPDLDALISRVVASPRVAPSRVWRSFRFKIGSALAASALVTSGAVALFSGAGPGLTVLALAGTSANVPRSTIMMVPEVYSFSAGPSLSLATPNSASYPLTLPDAATEASRLAGIFGVSGTPVASNGDTSWTVSAPSGASLDYETTGLPEWYYSSTSPAIAPATASSTSLADLPSAATLESDATTYLNELGYGYTVSDPSVSTSTTSSTAPDGSATTIAEETVDYQVDVNGIGTDQLVSFSVDNNNDLLYASGPAFDVGSSVAYPLQSPADALGVLNAAQQSLANEHTSTSDVAPGVAGSTSLGSSTSTTVPVEQVTISDDTLTLQTYVLADGSVWMLPVYDFTGTSTDASGATATNTWNELAVDPSYVQITNSATGGSSLEYH